MRLRIKAVACGVVWLLVGTKAHAQGSPADEIAKIVGAVKPGSMRMGIHVVELPSGRTVYELNAKDAFKPASNMKLLTTAAALDLLPPSFRYTTTLAVKDDNLIVLGTGDPSLGDPRLAKAAGQPITAMFHDWAARLQERGITEIKGDLIIDDTVFEAEQYNPNWPADQRQNWYSAPVGGLNFNDNCIEVTVKPGKPGEPCVIEVTPPNTYTTIRNECRTGNAQKPAISRVGDQPVYVVSGTCKSAGTLQSVAVPDAGLFFASAMRTALAAKGIRIHGQIRRARVRDDRGNLPPEYTTIAVYERPLTDLLGRINKNSQNLFAECLLKTIGFQVSWRDGTPDVGSYESGRRYVERFLTKTRAPRSADLCIDDGSGYSHKNRLTPQLITSVLTYMARHPLRNTFADSLAVAGQDGTLEKRMTDIRGQVRAKTGYIAGVHALSGYAGKLQGYPGRFAFSMLFNYVTVSGSEAHQVQDQICRALVVAAEKLPPPARPATRPVVPLTSPAGARR